MRHVDKRVDCDVTVPEELRVGKYANSFRVRKDGEEYLVDFLLYSPGENKAVLVARVRIKTDLLSSLLGNIQQALTDVTGLLKRRN